MFRRRRRRLADARIDRGDESRRRTRRRGVEVRLVLFGLGRTRGVENLWREKVDGAAFRRDSGPPAIATASQFSSPETEFQPPGGSQASVLPAPAPVVILVRVAAGTADVGAEDIGARVGVLILRGAQRVLGREIDLLPSAVIPSKSAPVVVPGVRSIELRVAVEVHVEVVVVVAVGVGRDQSFPDHDPRAVRRNVELGDSRCRFGSCVLREASRQPG